MGQAVLELYDLKKKYGKRMAVDGVTLTVNSGEIYGFLGPNGAGKTTTIRMIVGLASITGGEIRVCGSSIKTDFENAVKNIGGIIENPELYGYLTGRQNLELFAGLYKDIPKGRIDEVIGLVGLRERIYDRLKKYSLGMRQRAGIAQSLLHNPKILILDEPTNGLDPSGIHEMRDLLKRLSHEQGVAVFISSHILSEMQLMCDRAAIIDHGRIVKVLTLEELNGNTNAKYNIKTDNPESARQILLQAFEKTEIYVKDKSVIINIAEESIPKAVSLLVAGGVLIYGVRQESENLEATFLSATRGSRIN